MLQMSAANSLALQNLAAGSMEFVQQVVSQFVLKPDQVISLVQTLATQSEGAQARLIEYARGNQGQMLEFVKGVIGSQDSLAKAAMGEVGSMGRVAMGHVKDIAQQGMQNSAEEAARSGSLAQGFLDFMKDIMNQRSQQQGQAEIVDGQATDASEGRYLEG
jgi:hypothetical protein